MKEKIKETFPVTFGELHDSVQYLNVLFNQPMRPSVAMLVKRMMKQMKGELAAFEVKRTELCRRFGTLNKETQTNDIAPENLKAFESQYAEMTGEVVDIEGRRLSVFDLSEARLSPIILNHLEWLIAE